MGSNSMHIFKRKTYDQLLLWKKKSNGSTAILLEGARRVGKSTLVREFGKNEYRSYIMIDFNNPNKATLKAFEDGIHDMDLFFNKLQLFEDTTLYARESLIILDEIQKYPKAREMIKYFVEDGRYDFIETGSLISIKNNIKSIQIPSEEKRIQMYPMDFEEYLWANDDERTIGIIKDAFAKLTPVDQDVHRHLISKYREYMIVGGMPQSVSTYLSTKSFIATDEIKQSIIELYTEDMEKIPSSGYRASLVFSSIPSLLSNKNKRFSPGSVEKNTRTEDYWNAVFGLGESKTTLICHDCTDPDITIPLNTDQNGFKLYLCDTGLLITMSFMTGTTVANETYKALMYDKLSINNGMFFENMVAQELRTHGHVLFYHTFKTKEESKNLYEVDFLIAKGKKITPIEVKSSYSSAHASLDHLMDKYKGRVDKGIVIHSGNLRVEDKVLYLPIYMTMFL